MADRKPYWAFASAAIVVAISLMLLLHFGSELPLGPFQFFALSFVCQCAAAAFVAQQIWNPRILSYGLALAILFEIAIALGIILPALASLAAFDALRNLSDEYLGTLALTSKSVVSLLAFVLLTWPAWRWLAPRAQARDAQTARAHQSSR